MKVTDNALLTRASGQLLLIKVCAVLALTVLSTMLFASGAWADTFTVTNTKDSGAGSLRSAIKGANYNAGADEIVFADGASGSITLLSALPNITDPAGLSINGGGDITVSGNHAVRVLEVASEAKLELRNLTVADGEKSGDCLGTLPTYPSGGGIYNAGDLTVTNSTIADNEARSEGPTCSTAGGGIYNDLDAELEVRNSTFSGNSAFFVSTDTFSVSGLGGAIVNAGVLSVTNSNFSANTASDGGGIFTEVGTAKVTGSAFSDNSADGLGGGIAAPSDGALEVEDSTFSGNHARNGGAIHTSGSTTKVTRSTISGNSADFTGGAIMNAGATLTVTDSTLSGNIAYTDGGGIYNQFESTLGVTNSTFSGNSASSSGGGIYNNLDAELEVRNSTFSGNSSELLGGIFGGGGLFNEGAATLSNTIIADSPSGGNCFWLEGSNPITDGGYNIDDDGTCGFTQATGSLSNTDPLLDPDGLQDNGGPTKTIALQPNSPAVDLVDQGACPPPATDQRGVARPQGAACDSGAFELKIEGPSTCTINGTRGDDFLKGTSGNDVICARGGDDVVIDYKGGADTLFGNGGKDVLLDIRGRGVLKGGDGSDVLFALDDAPLDTMNGQAGNDFCVGDKGDVRKDCERGSLISLSEEERKRLDEAKSAAGL